MTSELGLDEVIALAESSRVDLGMFTVEDMWRWGLPLGVGAPREDGPLVKDMPYRARIFFLCGRPPRPGFYANVGMVGAETNTTKRQCSLVTPTVARVSELRLGQLDGYVLSVQSLAGVLHEVWLEGGFLAPPLQARVTTLALHFPYRFGWIMEPRRLRSPRPRLEVTPLKRPDALFTRITVTVEPSGARTLVQDWATELPETPPINPEATPDDIVAYAHRFYATYWDRCKLGPRPTSP